MRIEMYVEKRQQPYWLLALSLLMTSTFGVAVYAAVTETTGLVVGLVSSVAVGVWWWQGRAPIMVTSDALQVGRMKLPLECIGTVTPLDASEFALRSGRNARADDVFSLLQRRHGGVVVENLDATDPFRHWVMGSRHAFQLADAITAAKETR